MRLFVALAFTLTFSSVTAAPPHVGLLREAAEAAKANDSATVIAKLEAAAQLRPDYPRIQINLARAYAGVGRTADALSALQRLADMGVQRNISTDAALAALRDISAFQSVAARLTQGPATVPTDPAAGVTLPAVTGIIEGLLHDTTTDLWYFSDVRHRCIWRFDPKSTTLERFTSETDALDGVFRLALSPDRSTLWASTATVGVMSGNDAEDGKRSALAAIDFQTGRVRARFPVPSDGRKHLLGDFVFAADGSLYATDSFSPIIWRLPAGGQSLEPWLEHDEFLNLQGLAFSHEGHVLHVADYSNGLWQISVSDKRTTLLKAPANATFFGIDGLYSIGDDLLAVQNGVEPQRILRITPSQTDAPSSTEIVALDPRSLTDLSLGAIEGDTFSFIANSGWALFDPMPTQPPPARPVHILSIPLS